MEELAIGAVGFSFTHHLVLVACLVQAQVHFLTVSSYNKIWLVDGVGAYFLVLVLISRNFCINLKPYKFSTTRKSI